MRPLTFFVDDWEGFRNSMSRLDANRRHSLDSMSFLERVVATAAVMVAVASVVDVDIDTSYMVLMVLTVVTAV